MITKLVSQPDNFPTEML